MQASPAIPKPTQSRWQPLRAGLVNIFHYDAEEFWFRDGHLLLRGNNGTGKSKVLALTLPFLLDGQLAPARVEPDGDPGKRMEWNLLLGGRHSERLGYTWLEFGRLRDDGIETVTLGCGLKAVQGRGSPRTWFFITDQRIGENLWLMAESDYALSRERLSDALEGRGMIFDTAVRYRHAVDEKLFQLGEERYNALINLLIQLRQPQLSRRPDPEKLSAALTEALPPLDQAVLNDVADAFHNLESERQELESLREAHQAVDRFRGHYRIYAQIGARRQAQAVRQAQTRCDKVSGELNDTREQLTEAVQQRQSQEAHLQILTERLHEGQERERVLRESPEMRDVESLRQAEELAEEKARMAAQARRRQQEVERDLERRTERLRERHGMAVRGLEAVQGALAEAEHYAGQAGIEKAHHGMMALALPGLDPNAVTDEQRIQEAENQAQLIVSRRQRDIDHLQDLNRHLEQAQRALHEARERLQLELDQAERLDETRLQVEQQVVEEGKAYLEAFVRFADRTQVLTMADPEAIATALEDWVSVLAGDNPARLALSEAYRQGVRRLEEERAEARAGRERQQTQHDQLTAERQRLEAGEHTQPPSPYTRDAASRETRSGASLWQLVDFLPTVPEADRAGLEAALEGAGLLDAWVLPEGRLLEADTWDVMLSSATAIEPNLNEVLLPAVDRDDTRTAMITDAVLEAILAAIGYGESGSIWVDERGRWRAGPAYGSWSKPEAQYIGRGAREAARRRRLAELAGLLREVEEALARSDRRLEKLAEQRRWLEQEWQTAPSDDALRRLHDRAADLLEDRRRLQTRIDRAERGVTEARERLEQPTRKRDQAAQDLVLPTDPGALAAITGALADYRASLRALWPQLRHHRDNNQALKFARDEYEETQQRLEESAERTTETEQAARSAAVRRDTLRATVGETVERLETQLRDTLRMLKELEAESRQTRANVLELAGRIGNLTSAVKNGEEHLERERKQRHQAIGALRTFHDDGLLAAAVAELEIPEREDEWPVETGLKVARQTEQALQAVDAGDSAWDRHRRGLYEHLTTLQGALSRHGHEAGAEQTDSGMVVRIVFQSRACTPDELARRLSAEEREREVLLSAREQELLETHLISEVASHLQGMIGDAERQVQRMNEELQRRPTSTGMRLRLLWRALEEGQAGAPTGLAEARKRLLRQIADAWSADDREAIGRFLRQRIEEVRAAEGGGTLLEHLEKALDYRRWHRFRVERWQDGHWRPAAGPASGGERALAATIPLFAAASSHYASAGAQAPRLVLLDEAFAGIDDDARAKCMGLLAQFDLDFMMTSEREWGCYADLPGLAIAQLARREGIDAVFVTRWTWDGARRERATVEPPSRHAAERRPAQAEATGELF